MPSPIKGTAEQIADVLREEIERGVLASDAPLNQVELAERFGLSRIPVREALNRLEAEGYLISRPNRGAVVAPRPGPGEIAEILEIRELLETRIMQHAVERVTPSVVARAREALSAMNRAHEESEVRGAHSAFHAVFFDAARRPKMARIVGDWRFDLKVERQRSFLRSTREVHRKLLEAVSDRRSARVAACVRDEYALIRKLLL